MEGVSGGLEPCWSGGLSSAPRTPLFHRYFGFITKHPADHRFACHVFVSEDSTKALAESVGYVCVLPIPTKEQALAAGLGSSPHCPASPVGCSAALETPLWPFWSSKAPT